MRDSTICSLPRLLGAAMMWAFLASACGGAYEETISGVKVPVPKAMAKSMEKPVEMSILGFGAGQASFHGNMETDKLIEFYKKEMPARGWQPNMSLRSGSTLLAYSKDGKTMLVAVAKQNNATQLTVTVGGAGR